MSGEGGRATLENSKPCGDNRVIPEEIPVRRTSVLRVGTHDLYKNLPALQTLIRHGPEAEAVALFQELTGGMMKEEYGLEEIRRESAFLKLVDASKALGSEASKRKLTPRQSLISAALGGWYGDEVNSWASPVARSDFLAWGESHYLGPKDHLEVAFRGLEAEGLFFEVHPGVFEGPCYFCSYDPEFLEELPDGGGMGVRLWAQWREYHNRHSLGWESAGLCMGQGSQSGANDYVGLCLGTSCCCFAEADARCTHGLTYNPVLQELVAKRKE